MAIHASPVEINLLKTAKLMTTFVVLTKNGKRTCRKLTMFRRMLGVSPRFYLPRLDTVPFERSDNAAVLAE